MHMGGVLDGHILPLSSENTDSKPACHSWKRLEGSSGETQQEKRPINNHSWGRDPKEMEAP